jgi:hypothetical protein
MAMQNRDVDGDFIEKEILAHRELGGGKTLAGKCASSYNEKLRGQIQMANDGYADLTKSIHGNISHATKTLDERRDSYNTNKHFRMTYLETQPPARRKYGFGSSDASKREEFMVNVRAAQQREKIRSEGNLQGVPQSTSVQDLLDETREVKGTFAAKNERAASKIAKTYTLSTEVERERLGLAGWHNANYERTLEDNDTLLVADWAYITGEKNPAARLAQNFAGMPVDISRTGKKSGVIRGPDDHAPKTARTFANDVATVKQMLKVVIHFEPCIHNSLMRAHATHSLCAQLSHCSVLFALHFLISLVLHAGPLWISSYSGVGQVPRKAWPPEQLESADDPRL